MKKLVPKCPRYFGSLQRQKSCCSAAYRMFGNSYEIIVPKVGQLHLKNEEDRPNSGDLLAVRTWQHKYVGADYLGNISLESCDLQHNENGYVSFVLYI